MTTEKLMKLIDELQDEWSFEYDAYQELDKYDDTRTAYVKYAKGGRNALKDLKARIRMSTDE